MKLLREETDTKVVDFDVWKRIFNAGLTAVKVEVPELDLRQ